MRISQLVYISKTVARNNDDKFRHHEGRGKRRSTDQEGRRGTPKTTTTRHKTYLRYPEKVKTKKGKKKKRRRRRCSQNFPVLFKVGEGSEEKREEEEDGGRGERRGEREWAGRD